MLQWLLVVAFSAVPLTLYVPPLRNLTLFVEAMGEFFTDSSLHTARFYQRLRFVCSRLLDCLFGNTRSM
ncbi:hypothetical protein RHGRI_001179 [Rhododendron griersonianum]|uniref:Secreted protein n=1 Tax=Rhododendron griersonianum TaxID=479676 RepID=A0AAV6LKF2_9ERIC|nr:hypothetical protein RHGRI_001179 [Rhododendron griersonianum]